MRLQLSELSQNQNYHLLIQTVLPRPIAWILTENQAGSADQYNLAPFSFFAPVCANPPTFVVSIGKKPVGDEKDTYVNLQQQQRCVVHIASSEQLVELNDSSATLNYGTSEITQQGIELSQQEGWLLPRIKQAPVAFYCRLQQCVDIGPGNQHVVFLEVEEAFVADDIAEQSGKRLAISAKALDPLSRLGGSEYATLGELMSRPRPE